MKNKKQVETFNVILWEFNLGKTIEYNVIPYLADCYDEAKDKPKTFEEFERFVDNESRYQWWGRCEYEILISDWPQDKKTEKWSVYDQIKLNLKLVTELVMKSCGEN